jgi:hypothetical protein
MYWPHQRTWHFTFFYLVARSWKTTTWGVLW